MPWVREPSGLYVRVDYSSVAIRSRLVSRFNLQEYPADPNQMLALESRITPVTQVDELLRDYRIEENYNADPGATGWFYGTAVPNGKRWTIYHFYITRSNGATLTTSHLRHKCAANSLETLITNWAAASEHSEFMTLPIVLNEDDQLRFYVAAYNAGDEVTLYLEIAEEDAFV